MLETFPIVDHRPSRILHEPSQISVTPILSIPMPVEAFDCVCEEIGLLKRNSITVPGAGGRRGSIVASAVAVEDVEETWEEAVKGGKIKTSWKYELGVMTRYSVCFCWVGLTLFRRRLWLRFV